MKKMKDWNGKEIPFAVSKGGVRVVAHPFDNLIQTGYDPWPPPEIIQKLYESRQIRAFDGAQRAICESGLGYYCDLQSLNSEDAITWSVFGTVALSEKHLLEKWLVDLFHLLDLEDATTDKAEIFLWRRIPHPDTLVSGGPEIDFGIITRNTVILGEAKWRSGVGTAQGKMKDKDQIQLRGEFLEKYGQRFFPTSSTRAVVCVSLLPDTFANNVPSGITFRATTWEQVCSLPSHPCAAEVQRYFEWKRENTIMIDSRKK
jgi:hypothetical protein